MSCYVRSNLLFFLLPFFPLPLLHLPLFPLRDGAGILVSRDVYEGIRQAQPSDVRAVEDIIRPFEEQVTDVILSYPIVLLLQNILLLYSPLFHIHCRTFSKFSYYSLSHSQSSIHVLLCLHWNFDVI